MNDLLGFADPDDLVDLATFIGRAKRVDPDGAVRLVGHHDLLTVQVCPLPGVGGVDVIGMRVWRLAQVSTVDVTVALAAVTDRLAHHATQLPVPPVSVLGAAWAGIAPPRQGWTAGAEVPVGELRTAAEKGIAEVAATASGVPPRAAAELRGRVWSRDLAGRPGVPAGMAFVAEALGFLGPPGESAPGESAQSARCGSWVRLTTSRGHVLARRGLF